MNDPILKLKLLAKTEMTIGRLHARRAASQALLSVVALFFVLLGLGMLNFAGYQALTSRCSPAQAALYIAIINMIIGGVILRFAARTGGESDEEKMAEEIRDLIYTDLNADVDTVKAEFAKMTDDVYRIRAGFTALTSGKIGGLVGLAPLIELLTTAVKRKKSTKEQKKA